MGEFGATLTPFGFDPSQDADLLDAFDRFVEQEFTQFHRNDMRRRARLKHAS